jgi:hypothetical protein
MVRSAPFADFQKRTGNKRFFLKKEGKTFCSFAAGKRDDANL